MKVFLAGTTLAIALGYEEAYEIPYVLESFAYFKEPQKKQIKNAKMFLLDSGAFTFMNSAKGGKVDFDSYLKKYINFIKENDIEYFFELDIDSITGYDKVKEYRRILEQKTGRRCIPVWHRSRGLNDFIQTAKEYDYMAIGGIAIKNITASEYRHFETLLNIAHHYGCKVHGLGFTNTKLLHKYKFDSVDSATWTSGGRFGQAFRFDGQRMINTKYPEMKTVSYKILNRHNLREWIKFQYFADCYL